jgi:hypothetical protein
MGKQPVHCALVDMNKEVGNVVAVRKQEIVEERGYV